MQIQVATLCDSAADYNGKLCILGTIESIIVRKLPVVIPHCTLALRLCFFTADEGEHLMNIRILDADGKSVTPAIEPRITVNLAEEATFMSRNMVLNMQGLRFQKAGEYAIQVAVGNKILIELPLRVVHNPPNQIETA